MAKITASAWARKQGFSRQYAAQLIQAGIIVRKNGWIDEEEADERLRQRRWRREQRLRQLRGSYGATAAAGCVKSGGSDMREVEALIVRFGEILEALKSWQESCLEQFQGLLHPEASESAASVKLFKAFARGLLPPREIGKAWPVNDRPDGFTATPTGNPRNDHPDDRVVPEAVTNPRGRNE